MRKWLLASTFLIFAGDAAADTSLTVWTRIPEEGLKPFFDAFEERHPDISLEVEYIPGGKNHINKLVAAVAAGAGPDFTTLDVIATEQFAQLDALLPLDDIIAEHTELSVELFPRGPLMTGNYEGTQYALPFGGDGSFVPYNRAIFVERGLDPDSPPATWAEFTETAKQLTFDRDGDGSTDVHGFLFIPSQPWLTTFYWLPYFWMAGGEFMNEDRTEFTFNSAAGVEAMSHLMDLHHEHGVVPPSAIGAAATTDNLLDLLQGRVAMAFSGPNVIARVARDAPDFDLGIMPHPTPTADTPSTTFAGGDNVAIMADIDDDKLDAAIELMKWLTSVEGQRVWHQTKYFLPVRGEVAEDDHYADKPLERKALEIYLTAHEPPVTSHYVEVQQYLRDAFEQVAFDLASPQEALDEAAQRGNQLIERTGRP